MNCLKDCLPFLKWIFDCGETAPTHRADTPPPVVAPHHQNNTIRMICDMRLKVKVYPLPQTLPRNSGCDDLANLKADDLPKYVYYTGDK